MLCVAIRTGFYSTQGELMRMLEVSQDRVGDTLETTVSLAIVLTCALAFASFVMRSGLADGNRSHYDLVLRCVLVVTSVVPPLLPLQLAFAPELKGSIGEGPNHSNHSNHSNSFKIGIFSRKITKKIKNNIK